MLELVLLLLLLQQLLLLLQEEFVRREKYQILGAVSLPRAGQTENGSTHEKETRRDEGYVDGAAWLELVAFWHVGVQETDDNLICVPRGRNKAKKTRGQKAGAGGHGSVTFSTPSPAPASAL